MLAGARARREEKSARGHSARAATSPPPRQPVARARLSARSSRGAQLEFRIAFGLMRRREGSRELSREVPKEEPPTQGSRPAATQPEGAIASS